MLVHWDEVPRDRFEWEPETAAWWRDLGRAAGTRGVGVRRMEVDPGKQSVPAHVHTREEEIVFVLDGSGRSWQDGRTYPIRARDCIVHVPDREAHTLIAGDEGLDVLVYGTREVAEFSYLPRAGQAHTVGLWVDVAGFGSRPPEGVSASEDVAERPTNIVNVDDVTPETWEERDDMGSTYHALGEAAGSVGAGFHYEVIPPGKLNAPPHIHSAEEEIFVVVDGSGTLLLGDDEHPLRPGHVVARPPGTRIAHAFRADDEHLTLLVYGTREPNDITYYPRSRTFWVRGIGVIGRAEGLSREDVW